MEKSTHDIFINKDMITQQPNRPFCSRCRVALAKPNGISKHGFRKWHKYCASCAKLTYSKSHNYLKDKKLQCQCCGFVPEDKCQLDIIFKDNNKKNKVEDNLLTLCANCSRLHRKKERDKKSFDKITIDADVKI